MRIDGGGLSAEARDRVALGASLGLAWVLSIWPLPPGLSTLRPDFTALWVIYWAIALADQGGLWLPWCAGLVQDVLYGTPLGSEALAYTLLAFAAQRVCLRVRMFPLWQQIGVVFVLIAGAHGVLAALRHAAGAPHVPGAYLLSVLVTGLFWPVARWALGAIRRHPAMS